MICLGLAALASAAGSQALDDGIEILHRSPYSSPADMASRNDTVFVALGPTLRTFRHDGGAEPTILDETAFASPILDLEFDQERIGYVLTYDALHIVANVPGRLPRVLASTPRRFPDDEPCRVLARGGLVLILGDRTVRVYRHRSLTELEYATNFLPPGSVRRAGAFDGRRLWTLGAVCDLADPLHPVCVPHDPWVDDTPRDLFHLDGSLLAVSSDAVDLYKVRKDGLLRHSAHLESSFNSVDAERSGDTIAVAQNRRVLLYDVTDPSHVAVREIIAGDFSRGLWQVAAGDGMLHIIDNASNESPRYRRAALDGDATSQFSTFLPFPARHDVVALRGDRLASALWNGVISLYDQAASPEPVLLDTLCSWDDVGGLALTDDALVVTRPRFGAVCIGIGPAGRFGPRTLLAAYDPRAPQSKPHLAGSMLYFLAGDELRVFDIADPAHPVQHASVPLEESLSIRFLRGDDQNLIVWTQNFATVYNLQDPTAPERILHERFHYVYHVHVALETPYILSDTRHSIPELFTFTPAGDLHQIAVFPESADALDFTLEDGRAWIQATDGRLLVYDLSATAPPAPAAELPPFGWRLNLASDEGRVLAWTPESGLTILGSTTATPLEDPEPVEDTPLRDLHLSDPAPNPFNPTVHFTLDLAVPRTVTASVVDLRGRTMRRLHHGPTAAGRLTLRWDGRDDAGLPAESGVYLMMIRSGDARILKRMTLLK